MTTHEELVELQEAAAHVIATAWGNTDGLTAAQQLEALRDAVELLVEAMP